VEAGRRHIVVEDKQGDIPVCMLDVGAARRPAAILPLDSNLELRVEALQRFARQLRGQFAGPLPRALQLTLQRRMRLIMLLHALDFRLDGAGPRKIAAALIDAEEAELPAIEWKSSPTRRKANRLIHDAIDLMNGGYRKLLGGA
jgi:hypothetical protein